MKKPNLKNLSGRAMAAGTSFLFVAGSTLTTALAEDATSGGTSDVISTVTSGGSSGGGIFSDLISMLTSTGGDAYQLLQVIAMIVGIVCLSAGFISIAVAKKGQTREENKSWLVWILLGVGGVFMAGSIISIAVSAGSGISTP